MQRSKRSDPQRDVDEWNAKYPVGQKVRVRLDSGEVKETTTRYEATVLSGHTAVGWFNGIRGCYCLDRATAIDG